jgi:serine/threonine-protein kinase
VILYELLTGRVPFDAEAAVTIAIKHVSEAPVAPRTLNPAIPPELEQVALWSLNKNPADRPSDAQELIEALGYAKASIVSGTPTERTAAMAAIPVVVRTAATGNLSASQPNSSIAAERSPAPVLAPVAGDGRTTTQPPAPPTRRRRRDVWLWVVLVALLLAAGGAAAYYLLSAPTQVTVPREVGKQLTVAKPALERAGFKVTITYHRSTRAPGTVLNESPAGGTEADQGSTVSLTVSRGPGTVTVPQVQGATLKRAENLIRTAGLKVGKVQPVNDSQYPPGEVSSTSPIAGLPVPPGTAVNLFVSAGPPRKTVPNVTGQTESAARAALTSAGFTAQVLSVQSSSAKPGIVVGQNPAAGTQAAPGSAVTIDIAKAQPPPPTTTTKVPNVTGDTAATARSVLTAAGFSVTETMQTVSSKSQDGTVLSQSPSGGSSAKKGSAVTIVVGHYKKPPTHTTSTPTPPGAPLLAPP